MNRKLRKTNNSNNSKQKLKLESLRSTRNRNRIVNKSTRISRDERVPRLALHQLYSMAYTRISRRPPPRQQTIRLCL